MKVINLKAVLSSSVRKVLSELMKLYDKDFDRFFDNLGFNFQINFEWVDLKDKINLEVFIKEKIAKMIDKIEENFENNVQFFFFF